MNDAVIREGFRRQMLTRRQLGDALVVDELGLRHGKCRADIAVVNGFLSGYEIKSDDDSLFRLADQVKVYSAVFDCASVITCARHAKAVESCLPKWWGIVIGHPCRDRNVTFEVMRHGVLNRHVDPFSLAQLLWSDEAASILAKLGEAPKTLRQRRAVLYERLIELVSLAELRRLVTRHLKSRQNWRLRVPPSPNDGWFRPIARS